MNKIASLDFDVLIVGAGLVGASLALALANQPLKIGMIEAHGMNLTANPHNDRALALTASSYRFFEALGLWTNIQPHAMPITQVHVSEAGHFGATRFAASDYSLPALGYVISASSLLGILQAKVLQQRSIQCLCPAHITRLERLGENGELGYQVHVQSPQGNQTFTTQLLVAADGADSKTRRLLGISVLNQNYHQHAITARVTLASAHKGIAYERFTEYGILAALPFSSNQYAMVWTMDDRHMDELTQLDDTEFCQRLQHMWGYRLGRFMRVEQRSISPLRGAHAVEQIRPGAVLLGNAAHTLHPVAAQGFNLSVRDVAALAEIITEGLTSKQNLGAMSLLNRYGAWRQQEQALTMRCTHGLAALFSTQTFPLMWGRHAGLAALDILTPAKSYLAKQAMGLGGRLAKKVCV